MVLKTLKERPLQTQANFKIYDDYIGDLYHKKKPDDKTERQTEE